MLIVSIHLVGQFQKNKRGVKYAMLGTSTTTHVFLFFGIQIKPFLLLRSALCTRRSSIRRGHGHRHTRVLRSGCSQRNHQDSEDARQVVADGHVWGWAKGASEIDGSPRNDHSKLQPRRAAVCKHRMSCKIVCPFTLLDRLILA